MKVFNQVLATLLSIVLIAGSAIGIVYLIGLIAQSPQLTQFAQGIQQSLSQLSAGEIQAVLIGIFAVSLVLFVLEVRPWRPRYVTIRDEATGATRVSRTDIERYLMQRLTKDMQKEAITPESLDLQVHGDRFDVAAGLAIPSIADRQAVREHVEADIKDNLSSIGMEEDLDRISARVSRVKRVA